MTRVFFLLLVFLALAGCAVRGAPDPAAVGASDPAQVRIQAESTLAALAAQERAEREAAQQQTRTAAEAVAAQTAVAATATTEAVIAATQVVLDAETVLRLEATRIYIESERDRQRMALEAEQREQDLYFEAQRLVLIQQQRAEAARQARIDMWTRIIPALILFVVAVCIAAAVAYVVWTDKRRGQVVVLDGGERLVSTGRGYAMLPASTRADPPSGEVAKPAPLAPAEWGIFAAWSPPRGERFLIGAGPEGAITINRKIRPHLLISGMTGSGKSTAAVTYALQSLRCGYQVIIFNARAADFIEFDGGASVHVVRPRRGEAHVILAALMRAVIAEMDRREQLLRQTGARHWDETAGVNVTIIIDEFLSIIHAARQGNSGTAETLWHGLIAATSEARKTGIQLILTLTDSTGRAIEGHGLTIREQCARVVFASPNADACRKLVGSTPSFPRGTADFRPGEFLALVGRRVEHGITFAPTSAQIREYLSRCGPAVGPLPPAILAALRGEEDDVVEGEYVVSPLRANGHASATAAVDGHVAADAARLLVMPSEARRSRNQAAAWLAGRLPGEDGVTRANRDDYARLHEALQWLSENEAAPPWAAALLEQY